MSPRPAILASSVLLALAAPAGVGWTGNHYLPDTTILLRVGDRVVRAGEFADTYYSSWPEFRPPSDSAGRVQFLDQFINKEVMGLVAQRAGRPLSFEDRIKLKQWEEIVLANVLYQRLVYDSVQVTDADLEALRREYSREKRLKHIVCEDLATAERVRADLLARRITWKEAHRRHSKKLEGDGPEGDLGWVSRTAYPPAAAFEIFDLEPGQTSRPYQDQDGFHLVTATATRPIETPGLTVLDSFLRNQIRQHRTGPRVERAYAGLRAEAGLTYDSANVAWAAGRFEPPPPVTGQGGNISLTAMSVPKVPPQDTGRVLARWKDGQMTLGRFLAEYRQTQPMLRGHGHTPELLRQRIDGYVLRHYKSRLAVSLGLDKDPLTVRLMEKRREEILVEHMFADSIQSRVWITPADRRRYYEENRSQYMTFPEVRYVSIRALSQASAESLAARLRAGEPAEAVLRADSLRHGQSTGAIGTVLQNDEGMMFHKLLFEELKPGQVSIQLDEDGRLWVVQSLAFDPGRQLSFEEADHYVTESLENLAAERLIQEFLARHKRGLTIEARPDLVMRVDFQRVLME
jgi:hypothetical protein